MNRIILIKKCLEQISAYASYSGVSYFHHDNIKYHWYYNKIFMNIILFTHLLREIISLTLKDQSINILMGDIAYNWKIKIIWSLILINCSSTVILFRLLHFWHYKHGHIPMISTNTILCENASDKKSLLFINCIKYLIIFFIAFSYFIVNVVILVINAPNIPLLLVGMYWSIYILPWCISISGNFMLNFFYFCLIAYKFKLQLQLENIRLKQLSTKQLSKPLIERQLLRIISRIFKIYKQIKDENKFWSKWLLIHMSSMTISSSLFINQIFFGETNLFLSIFIILIWFFVFMNFSLFNYCCVIVHNESNYTIKLLRKLHYLFFKERKTQGRFKIKVKFLISYKL